MALLLSCRVVSLCLSVVGVMQAWLYKSASSSRACGPTGHLLPAPWHSLLGHPGAENPAGMCAPCTYSQVGYWCPLCQGLLLIFVASPGPASRRRRLRPDQGALWRPDLFLSFSVRLATGNSTLSIVPQSICCMVAAPVPGPKSKTHYLNGGAQGAEERLRSPEEGWGFSRVVVN